MFRRPGEFQAGEAMVLVAHGSRSEQSNEEVKALTTSLAEHYSGVFSELTTAFLELAEPSIEQAIEQCISRGAKRVLVMPYFLAAGRHVSRDIPRCVARARAAAPDIPIELAPHLGISPLIEQAIMAVAVDDSRPLPNDHVQRTPRREVIRMV